MKIASIKKLATTFELEELQKAEQLLLEGEPLNIEVEGEDDGERLTHILAAAFVKEQMQNQGIDLKAAIRAYSSRVRQSIS